MAWAQGHLQVPCVGRPAIPGLTGPKADQGPTPPALQESSCFPGVGWTAQGCIDSSLEGRVSCEWPLSRRRPFLLARQPSPDPPDQSLMLGLPQSSGADGAQGSGWLPLCPGKSVASGAHQGWTRHSRAPAWGPGERFAAEVHLEWVWGGGRAAPLAGTRMDLSPSPCPRQWPHRRTLRVVGSSLCRCASPGGSLLPPSLRPGPWTSRAVPAVSWG